jgi:hypothetical protein
MTIDGFRRLAMQMPGAAEVGHMGHPDFRVGGKIFATLGYPTSEWAMVKLAPDQQEAFCTSEPAVFIPVKGKWVRGVRCLPASGQAIQREACTHGRLA